MACKHKNIIRVFLKILNSKLLEELFYGERANSFSVNKNYVIQNDIEQENEN